MKRKSGAAMEVRARRVGALRVLALVIALPGAAFGQITVGGFDATRSGETSIATGAFFDDARMDLESNFGVLPGAIVGLPTLTWEGLEGLDVLIISSTTDQMVSTLPLSAGEQEAVFGFLGLGGCALLLADNDTFAGVPFSDLANESILDPVGMDAAGTLLGPQLATVPPSTHPLIVGPFGTVTEMHQFFPGSFDGLGLAVGFATNSIGPALAAVDHGTLSSSPGAAVAFSDTNSFADDDSGIGQYSLNQVLFLNSVAFCLQADRVFADGFESGGTARWSQVVP